MGTVNINLAEAQNLNLPLGLQLENEVTEVVFDFSAWQTAYGSGDLGLSIQRPGDSQPYAGELTIDGTDATWTVSSLDIAYKGVGEIQLTYTVGTVVKKSVIYKFTVYKSLGANGEYPSPGQTWQEEIEDEIADVKADLAQVSGLSADIKAALDQIAQKVAYIDDDGQDYYDALHNALYPPATLSYITCVYTQSGTVYDTDSLDSLKDDLVVTAHNSDESTFTVTSYVLSGTLTEGTSTITVAYGGKTTTFDVTVTEYTIPAIVNWDFTKSLADKVSGKLATLGSNVSQESDGIHFNTTQGNYNNAEVKLGGEKIDFTDKTIIIKIVSSPSTAPTSKQGRLFYICATDGNSSGDGAGFLWRYNSDIGWTVYLGNTWPTGHSLDTTTYPIDFFANKKLKLYIDSDRFVTVSYANMDSDEYTTITKFSNTIREAYIENYPCLGGSANNDLSGFVISGISIHEGEV